MDIRQAVHCVLEGTSIDELIATLLERAGTASLTTPVERVWNAGMARMGKKAAGLVKGGAKVAKSGAAQPKVVKGASKILRGAAKYY